MPRQPPPDCNSATGARLGRRSALAGLLASAAGLMSGSARAPSPVATPAIALIAAARTQIGITQLYDPQYVRLAFPGGDVARARGVCSDVVIRAYRDAFSLDLQALLHADMGRAFAAYPHRWGLSQPDSNIDHRRVGNLQMFLKRKGAERPAGDVASLAAGDLLTMLLPGNLPHIGIVSDQLTAGGIPLFIHNIGAGAQEEDVLTRFARTGRYRWLPG